MKNKFIGVYNPSIILTYIGVFCAVAGIGLLLSASSIEVSERLDTVMILLIISGVCDMFDGAAARLFKRTDKEKQFGIQLDSLADTVSFVAFPATILMFVTDFNPVCALIACFYVFAGIMRLGWFNVTTGENKGCYFGLPVTVSALLIPLTYIIVKLFCPLYMPIVYPVVFACTALLFILNFKLKKPKLKVLIALAVLALFVIIGLFVI